MDLCAHDRCDHKRLTNSFCLRHSGDEDLFIATHRWRQGEPIDLRDMEIEEIVLQRLLSTIASANADSDSTPLSPDRKAEIWSEINFEGARFVDGANFHGVVFKKAAYFDHAEFCGRADFGGGEFSDHADFDNARFGADATFHGTIFDDHAGFQNAHFKDTARFVTAKFRSYVDLEGARFAGLADMREASFQFARRFGRFEVADRLQLDHCEFAERTTIEVSAAAISAASAIFAEGVRLLVEGAEMELDCVDFGRSATLSALAPHGDDTVHPYLSNQPKLLTLHGAQVSSLAISGVDLTRCRFFGAHGLETMVIEPSCLWCHTPRQRRLSDRQILCEEWGWRQAKEIRRRSEGWREAAVWSRGESTFEDRLRPFPGERNLLPMELAALYRALRKAREDNKDQAGAGDLYYGEMEMRRNAPSFEGRGRIRSLCDKAIITGYWLLSGYGLKASRALIAWLAVTLVAALALARWGISPSPSAGRSVLFAIESTTSLVRPAYLPNPYVLRSTGEAIQVSLRLIGPVLFGLFLLALRARVKR